MLVLGATVVEVVLVVVLDVVLVVVLVVVLDVVLVVVLDVVLVVVLVVGVTADEFTDTAPDPIAFFAVTRNW